MFTNIANWEDDYDAARDRYEEEQLEQSEPISAEVIEAKKRAYQEDHAEYWRKKKAGEIR